MITPCHTQVLTSLSCCHPHRVLPKATTWFTQMFSPANGACTYNYLELLEMVYAMELFYAMFLDSCVTYNLYATDIKDICLLYKHQ